MFSKWLTSVLIVTSSFIIAFGQTPEAKKEKQEKEKAPTAFAWSFDGDGGYLGVQTQEVTKENFAKFGLRTVSGVAVEKVLENSPAAAAGIQNGDVIVRFNGEEITSGRKLTRLVGEVAADHQVSLTVSRGGREQEITVTIGKRPTPKFENGNFEFMTPGPMGKMEMPDFKWQMKDMPDMKNFPQLKEMPEFKDLPQGDFKAFTLPNGEGKAFTWQTGAGRQIGIGVTPLGKQLAEHFGVDGGVMISEVRENSPASKAGLKAGDIIVEINGKTVKGDGDLIRAVNEKKEGDVTLTIVRDRNRQTVTVTPEASRGGGFFFQTDDGDGMTLAPTPATPRPAIRATPMAAPLPMTFARPGRII